MIAKYTSISLVFLFSASVVMAAAAGGSGTESLLKHDAPLKQLAASGAVPLMTAASGAASGGGGATPGAVSGTASTPLVTPIPT